MKTCSVKDCTSKVNSKGLCSRHYQQVTKSGKRLQLKAESLDAPKVAPNKKRCHARMRDGSQCVRRIDRAQLCFAHHKEAADREHCELRENPIEAEAIGFEGREEELAAKYGSESNVCD
jgi:hypothetical protein